MSDVHSDWKDYGRSNYTVCARIDSVTEGKIATVRQMENIFEAKIDSERETMIKKQATERGGGTEECHCKKMTECRSQGFNKN